MKYFYTTSFLFLISFAFAQPTITNSLVPQVGDIFSGFVNAEGVYIESPGDSGENVIWDFSGLPGGAVAPIDLIYVNATESPFADSFPEANLAAAPRNGNPEFSPTSFFSVTDDEFITYGNSTSVSTTVFTDPLISMVFPFNFNDNFSDDFASTTSTTAFETHSLGSLSFTYDAFGTLSTPVGTYNDVLRIKNEQTVRDSIVFITGITAVTEITSVNYAWIKNDLSINLASYVVSSGTQTILFDGQETITTEIPETITFNWSLYNEVTSSVENKFADFEILSTGPNPTTDQFNIKLLSGEGKDLDVVLINSLGHQLIREKRSIESGEDIISFDMNAVPSGNYILQVKDGSAFQSFQVVKLD